MAARGAALLLLCELLGLVAESSRALGLALQRLVGRRRRRVSAMGRGLQRRWGKGSSRRRAWQERWLALAEAEAGGHPRRWVIPRSTEWWDGFVHAAGAEEEWLERFRMSRATFYGLLEAVAPRLRRAKTRLREPVPVEKRLAIALWFLSGKSRYREVRERFGVGLSTVGHIIMEVCLALRLDLLSETVGLGEAAGTIMDGFAQLGFPHCIGALDSTRVQIRAHRGRGKQYAHHKQYCSVLLQGVVDHTGRFIDAEIVWGGKDHSGFDCESSGLFKAMDAGLFVPGNPMMTLDGVQVPALMVADGAYPIRCWLMKPYGQCRDRRRRTFDRALSRARNVAESAFGRLKSRWRCLQDRLDVSERNVASIITACVILHNICEREGHPILGELDVRDPFPDSPAQESSVRENRHKEEGERVRDAIADFLMLQQCRQSPKEEEEEETQGQIEDHAPVEDSETARDATDHFLMLQQHKQAAEEEKLQGQGPGAMEESEIVMDALPNFLMLQPCRQAAEEEMRGQTENPAPTEESPAAEDATSEEEATAQHEEAADDARNHVYTQTENANSFDELISCFRSLEEQVISTLTAIEAHSAQSEREVEALRQALQALEERFRATLG